VKIKPSAVHIKPGLSRDRDLRRASSFTIQHNRRVLVKKGADPLSGVACRGYLKDRLVRANSHPGTEAVCLEEV
jgi:hypothetical protein